jgi:hypothetical protein
VSSSNSSSSSSSSTSNAASSIVPFTATSVKVRQLPEVSKWHAD